MPLEFIAQRPRSRFSFSARHVGARPDADPGFERSDRRWDRGCRAAIVLNSDIENDVGLAEMPGGGTVAAAAV
jgi:hypothetical protein